MLEFIIELMFWLVVAHAIGDFALQSEVMAKGKNSLTQTNVENTLPEKVIKKAVKDMTPKEIADYENKWKVNLKCIDNIELPQGYKVFANGQRFENFWFYWLSAHSLIHAGMLMLLTGLSIWFGIAEFLSHFIIDILKTRGKYGVHIDQFLHLCIKIIYVAIAVIIL